MRFPELLDEPMNNRIESAKTKAQMQLENVLKLHGSEVLLSLGQNRKRRQAADNLELSFTKVNSVTAVNEPIGTEIFHVYFKYVLFKYVHISFVNIIFKHFL